VELRDRTLRYYLTPHDHAPRGTFDLRCQREPERAREGGRKGGREREREGEREGERERQTDAESERGEWERKRQEGEVERERESVLCLSARQMIRRRERARLC
jgi:hypothetical protein